MPAQSDQAAIETVPVARLRPRANNARTHSRKQIRQIAESIRRFGFTNPVLIGDEGEEIGSFDLIFGCSGTANTYTATYTETRKRPETKRTPVALKDVSISLGRDSAVLRVVASESTRKPPELESSARGIVSANFMKALAEWGSPALMIETATTNNQETAIRVGNTGLARYFTKFAAACAKQNSYSAAMKARRSSSM